MSILLNVAFVYGTERLELNNGTSTQLAQKPFVRKPAAFNYMRGVYTKAEERIIFRLLGSTISVVEENVRTLTRFIDGVERSNGSKYPPLLLEYTISGGIAPLSMHTYAARVHEAELILPENDMLYGSLRGIPEVTVNLTRGAFYRSRTYAGYEVTTTGFQNYVSATRRSSDTYTISGLPYSGYPCPITTLINFNNVPGSGIATDSQNTIGYVIGQSEQNAFISKFLLLNGGITINDTLASGGTYIQSAFDELIVQPQMPSTTFVGTDATYNVFVRVRGSGSWKVHAATSNVFIPATYQSTVIFPDTSAKWLFVGTVSWGTPLSAQAPIQTNVFNSLTFTFSRVSSVGSIAMDAFSFCGTETEGFIHKIGKPVSTLPTENYFIAYRPCELGSYAGTPSVENMDAARNVHVRANVLFQSPENTISGVVYSNLNTGIMLGSPPMLYSDTLHVTTLLNGDVDGRWTASGTQFVPATNLGTVSVGVTQAYPFLHEL